MISIPLFRTSKSQQLQKPKFWCDLNIPAKLFYDNLGNEDLSFLTISGKPTEKELDKAWDSLYDMYFEKKDDRKAKLILKTKKKIAFLSYKIHVVRNRLQFLSTISLSYNQKREIIKDLNKFFKVRINVNAELLDEMHRIMTVQIPAWETNLQIEIANFDLLKKGKSSSFEASLDAINDSKGYAALDENVSLIRFLEAEKREVEKSKSRKKEENKKSRRSR